MEPATAKIKAPYKLVRMDEKGQIVELTEAEFYEWAKDYPEIQAMLLNPDSIEPDRIEEAKVAETW